MNWKNRAHGVDFEWMQADIQGRDGITQLTYRVRKTCKERRLRIKLPECR